MERIVAVVTCDTVRSQRDSTELPDKYRKGRYEVNVK